MISYLQYFLMATVNTFNLEITAAPFDKVGITCENQKLKIASVSYLLRNTLYLRVD
jgi:hypothetical protein